MRSMALLGACALLPWALCTGLRPSWPAPNASAAAARDRDVGRFRRRTLWAGASLVAALTLAGAWWADPALCVRSRTAGSWFFASVCAVTSWASLAASRSVPDEAASAPPLQLVGRTVQIAFIPIAAVGLALLAESAVDRWLAMDAAARALTSALLSVAAVLVVSPWLAVRLGLWHRLRREVEVDGASWRLVHLPVPAAQFVHVAALPWLRLILVSEGLLRSAPAQQYQALLHYEASNAGISRLERALRWAIAIPLCTSAFLLAFAAGAQDGRRLVAATFIATGFTLAAGWVANRQPSDKLALQGPSLSELARSLRSLPPPDRQALPRTSHQPLGPTLYDRLFALGHDPGRRPLA